MNFKIFDNRVEVFNGILNKKEYDNINFFILFCLELYLVYFIIIEMLYFYVNEGFYLIIGIIVCIE